MKKAPEGANLMGYSLKGAPKHADRLAPWNLTVSLQTIEIALPVLTLDHPLNDASLHQPLQISWNLPWYGSLEGIPGSSSTQIEVSSSPIFPESETICLSSSTKSVRLDVPLNLSTQHYWRVRAAYPTGEFGPWSSTRSFYRDPVAEVIEGLEGPFTVTTSGKLIGHRTSPWGLSQWNPGTKSTDWTNDSVFDSRIGIGPDGAICTVIDLPDDESIKIYDSSAQLQYSLAVSGLDYQLGFALDSEGTIYIETRILVNSFYEYWLQAVSSAGALKWKVKVPSQAWAGAPPTIDANGQILLCHSDKLIRFTTEGSVVSIIDWAGSTPFISTDGSMYSVDVFGTLRSWDQNGNLFWSKEASKIGKSPVVDSDGTIYLSVQETVEGPTFLWAFNKDGTTKWKTAQPWLEHLLLGAAGKIYGNSYEIAVAIDRGSGALIWTIPVWDYYSYPLTMLADGTLVVPNDNETLLILTPGLDTEAPWPMADHDPQGTRNAAF